MEVSINTEKHRAGPGAVVFFASNDVHSLLNIGDQPVTYFVINFYTDARHTVRDQPAAIWAPADKLRSCVVNWDDTSSKASPHDTRRSFVNSPTLTFRNLEIHATTAAPGRYPVQPGIHLHVVLIIMKESRWSTPSTASRISSARALSLIGFQGPCKLSGILAAFRNLLCQFSVVGGFAKRMTVLIHRRVFSEAKTLGLRSGKWTPISAALKPLFGCWSLDATGER